MIPLQTPLPDFDPSIAEEFGYAVTQGASFLGIPLIETQNLLHLLIRFAFNLVVSWVVARCFYYKKGGKRNYLQTFLLFSSAMFLLLFLMESVKLQIGFTLGLFAIFGMIRYRTETVPVREMTYLFVIIAMSVINGISLNISYAELVAANLLVIGLLWACEKFRGADKTASKIILYDRIELITPERRPELVEDLRKRLGTDILSVEVGHVDFLRDAAYLKVCYTPIEGETDTIGSHVKPKQYVD